MRDSLQKNIESSFHKSGESDTCRHGNSSQTLRIGMIGLDTSHCIAFAELLNDKMNPYYIPGGVVVCAFPGGSSEFSLSRDRVCTYTAQLRDRFGVRIVNSIDSVAEEVDAILLESVDGRQHLEQFRRIASFGKPVFIDKPFATTVIDAKGIIELAEDSGTPIFSCSSLRFAKGTAELGKEREVLGCYTFGPNAMLRDFPGFFWYGIHCAEILFSKMGKGCCEVMVYSNEGVDVVTGTWADGRVGSMYLYQMSGLDEFGCTVFCEGEIQQGLAQKRPPYYAMMIPSIVRFFQNGTPPVDHEETLEIMAFLEAANSSYESGSIVTISI